jgi:hypothetical protein
MHICCSSLSAMIDVPIGSLFITLDRLNCFLPQTTFPARLNLIDNLSLG